MNNNPNSKYKVIFCPFCGRKNKSVVHYDLRNEERHLYFTRHNGKHEDIYVSHYDKNHHNKKSYKSYYVTFRMI